MDLAVLDVRGSLLARRLPVLALYADARKSRRTSDEHRCHHQPGKDSVGWRRHPSEFEPTGGLREAVRFRSHLRCFSAIVIASAMTLSGRMSLSGSSASRRAPKRSYHRAPCSFFESIASATPPTSAATAKARLPAVRSRSPPRPLPCTVRSMAKRPSLKTGTS